MKHIILFTILFSTSISNAQVLLTEDFESMTLPLEWQIESNATDGGWRFGTAPSLSSQYFSIESNGTNIAATNDDACNCNKSNEYLITKPVDLTNVSAAVLKFDLFYPDQIYAGAQEDASIEISLDGDNWTLLDDLHGHGDWDSHIVNITDYVGNPEVYIGFRYDDNGGWLFGMAVDNVSIEVPNNLDASLVELDSRDYGEIGKEFKFSGTLLNNGIQVISSVTLQYTINSSSPITETIDNLEINAFEFYSFQFTENWIPTTEGSANIVVEIVSINNTQDDIDDNNAQSFDTEIFDVVIVPNKILQIANSSPTIKNIATASHGLDRPTDLDFFPVLGKDELWVINQRTENEGGSTLTISDATLESPSNFDMRVDGNSWHFMSLPTAIAFSDENFNFANSTGVQDANHNGGTFTGPALWSSDPDVYAQPSGGNGSHLDMLHGSPFCMGIAHEVDNVFWVYDDWNNDIVRYDFGEDHGPGNDDHSDGKLRRYTDIGIMKDQDIPNHMILDKDSGWLYFIDNGNSRVLRLDINSGVVGNSLPETNEPLAEHSRMINFTVETIIDSGLARPCGIEYFNGYLLVGNYGTGSINVYDVEDNYNLSGVIETGNPGLTGIKIAPDGNIFAVNRIQNTLISIEEGSSTSTKEYENENDLKIYPNPTVNSFSFDFADKQISGVFEIAIYNVHGQKEIKNKTQNMKEIDVSELSSGMYFLEVKTANLMYKKKFTIIK